VRAVTTITLAAAVAAAVAAIGAPGPVPEQVPDRGPVLSEPIRRGEVVLAERSEAAPVAARTIDGDAGDWVGAPSRIAGASVWDRGEHVHTDFVFDAHGADDGRDAARLRDFAGLFYAERRAERIDQVLRTSGSQLGVPAPLGAPDQYGDVSGGLDVGDLTEVRWGATVPGHLDLLVSVANLTEADRLGVLVLVDRQVGGGSQVGLGTGLTTERFDTAVLLTSGGATGRDLVTGTDLDLAGAEVAVGADGWDNHVEARLPEALLTGNGPDGPTFDAAVVTVRREADGTVTPLNAAYRHAEPVEIFNDRLQALDLARGTVDRFSSGPIAVTDLRSGRTEPMAHPGPGYHERVFRSDEDISVERGRDGVWQPYGLFVPTDWDPAVATPTTYWLHYRGGKAHSGTVINPRLTTQLGEERGNVVVFPHGRGTSEWYVTESHQDVFEVMADAEALVTVDTSRRYVSGYSMGGYGSWLFATLYPDLFAAAYVQSGAVTQGLWAGTDHTGLPDPALGQGYVEANDGDARAQLTFHALDNLRHVPFAIDHGTFDELVPVSGIERMAARLTELGYQHRFTRFLGYEHFTQAIVDEWADGAAWLDRFQLEHDPRRVTYTVVPALVWAVNNVDPTPATATFDFRPDGAHWVDDVLVRDVPIVDEQTGRPADAVRGTVDVTSWNITAPGVLPVVEPGVTSPPGHSTPYVRSGLTFLTDPTGITAPQDDNGFGATLTNAAGASLDVVRMRTDLRRRAGASWGYEVATDGPTTLRLVGALAEGDLLAHLVGWSSEAGVTFTADGDDLLLTFPEAGTYGFRTTVFASPVEPATTETFSPR
jgi:predicted peptidase